MVRPAYSAAGAANDGRPSPREPAISIDTLVPQVSASDLLPLQEISDLLRETGHPASVTTLRRWITRHSIHAERHGRATIASFSDILMVHRQEVLKRDGP